MKWLPCYSKVKVTSDHLNFYNRLKDDNYKYSYYRSKSVFMSGYYNYFPLWIDSDFKVFFGCLRIVFNCDHVGIKHFISL